jgi:DNA mismatch repair protein MutS2
MNIFPQDTVEKLEFSKIKEILLQKCISENGRELLINSTFSTHLHELEIQLKQVAELKSALDNAVHFPAQNYFSLDEEIKLLSIENNVLEGKQFRKIAAVVLTISEIFEFFKKHPDEYLSLKLVISDCKLHKSIIDEIDKIIDESGNVHSNASPELIRIRRELNSKSNELNKVFSRLVQQFKQKGVLSETTESVRNNRRVLSVQAESKRQINGIIHDESDSGKTSYIEPQETVLLNNDLFELERAEKREIYKILKELTARISAYKSDLKYYTHITAKFDTIRAKALLAIEMDACNPLLSEKPIIKLKDAYHPLLKLLNKRNKKPTIPVSVSLSPEQHLLLISGPNAGGKSVSLKTIGLIQMMVQFGLLVPCDENSVIGLFQQIFTDLGDNQSIEDELSTYSSRLTRMKYFIENCNAKTLYLIDEFGTGTDPRFGAAMAEAIMKSIIKTKAFGVITTHYSNLKKLAEHTPQVLNGAMLFNENNFTPTYILKTGKPGSSYTFAIAEKSGLSKEIIEEAKSLVDYSDLKFDELIEKIESERKQLEQENSKIKKENEQLKNLSRKFETLNQHLEQQKLSLSKQHIEFEKKKNELVQTEVNAVLNKINKAKSLEKAALQEKEFARMKENFLVKKSKESDKKTIYSDKMEAGNSVQHKTTQNLGEIIEIRGNKAVVNFNGLKTTVSMSDLILIETQPEKHNFPKKHIRKTPDVENVFDIRGLMQHDGKVQVEQYIDQALYNNIDEIKLIHGKGSGALRNMVLRIIKEYKANIAEWRYEEEKSGGDGATIIRFK